MFKIDEETGVMRITRGDTARFSIRLTQEDTSKPEDSNERWVPYVMQEGDSLLFSVKKNSSLSEKAIEKTSASTSFELISTDTISLAFGDYLYDVLLIFANAEKNTVIVPTTFKVCSEVHSHGNS